MRYYMIGPKPPVLGGISTFVYRQSLILQRQGNEVYYLFEKPRSRPALLLQAWRLWTGPANAVYDVHWFNFYAMLALLLRWHRPRRIVFYHHAGAVLDEFTGLKRRILRRFVAHVDEIVLVRDLRDHYAEFGYTLPRRVTIAHAFLPPPCEDEPRIVADYTSATRAFIATSSPLVVANAADTDFRHGVDVYGLDMLIELTAALRREFPRVGVLIALAHVHDREYFERLTTRARELGIVDHLHFMRDGKEFWPLLRHAHLLVRPTCTDGDAVSIREALYFHCPVVASDAAPRPDGVVTFPSRNQRALHAAVTLALSSPVEIGSQRHDGIAR